jgi:hypothetical protein
MSAASLTRAVLTENGRALIEQPDGSYRPAESRPGWDRARAMTEEATEAAATADPDAPPLDEAFWQEARVAFPRCDPQKAHRPASTRTCWPGSVLRVGVSDAHERGAARLRRGPEAGWQVARLQRLSGRAPAFRRREPQRSRDRRRRMADRASGVGAVARASTTAPRHS